MIGTVVLWVGVVAAIGTVVTVLIAVLVEIEPTDPEEEAEVAKARGEASVSWEEAKRGLSIDKLEISRSIDNKNVK